MGALDQVHLVLVLTRDGLLAHWDKSGSMEREAALYRAMAPQFASITFVSFGGWSERRYREALGGANIVCNRFGLPEWRYVKILPYLLWRFHFRRVIFKSNQVDGADLALSLARRLNGRFVARSGYSYSDFLTRYHGEGSKEAEEAVALERECYRAADQGLVTTEAMRARILAYGGVDPDRLAVLPNYVETDRFRPMPEVEKHPRRLFFLGRLMKQKNPYALLDAVAGLDVELLMAGDGPWREALEAHARKIGANVRFLGYQPSGALPRLMNESAALMLPSLYEGHPKALLEAMACGIPVIGGDAPGIREVIDDGENGILCGLEAADIRAAIARVLGDAALRKKVGRGARAYALEHLALDKIVERETGLYRHLAERAWG